MASHPLNRGAPDPEPDVAFSLGFWNGSQLEKHRSRFWPVTELARTGSKVDEPKFFVERDGVRFRVDDDAQATELIGQAVGEHEHGAEKRLANTSPTCPFIDGEPCQAKHGKRVVRQLPAP
jgi:hypothetical protein